MNRGTVLPVLPVASIPQPSGPVDTTQGQRWSHTRLRRRMLYGGHSEDVHAALRAHVGQVRKEAWGPPDMSANPYLSLWEQTAKLYAEEPLVTGDDDAVGAAKAAGLWSLMQRVQRDTLGLREMGVRVEVIDGAPVYTPVFPDLMEGRASASDPGQFVALTETRWTPGVGWTRVTWDAEREVYEAHDRDGNDVSAEVLGGRFVGDRYPYRLDGKAIVPVVLYHAAETSTLWDEYAGREIVDGSLTLSVYLTYFGHVLKNCAWAQRYAAGVDVGGAGLEGADGGGARREIVTDPSTLLMLSSQEGGGQMMIGQWAPPIQPDVLMKSIGMYEERLVESAGLRVDVTRQTADIRSGYSLAVARDSIREAQRSYEPLFERSDTRLLAITGALMGRPSVPVRIVYRGLPESPGERRARLDEIAELRAQGLLTRAGAYRMLHPELNDAAIRAALAEIDAERTGATA